MKFTNATVLAFSLVLVVSSVAQATYTPALGRWLQRDPAGYVDGVNLYQYVQGRPTNLVDPLGEDSNQPCNKRTKDQKCQAAANSALHNCLKAWRAGGPGAPSRDSCFDTFDQSMDACRRGQPGTHNQKVMRGTEFTDCMGRCLDSLNAAEISIGAGIGSQVPIPKNIGGIQILRGPGWGKSIDVVGGGLADRLPGGLRDSVGSRVTGGLQRIRGAGGAAGALQGGIIISGGVALSFETYCAIRCGINNRAY